MGNLFQVNIVTQLHVLCVDTEDFEAPCLKRKVGNKREGREGGEGGEEEREGRRRGRKEEEREKEEKKRRNGEEREG